MSAKVLKISAKGSFEFCEVETEEDGSIGLEELQGAVGGCIEHVAIPKTGCDELDLWLNEEGKLMELPVNDLATNLCEIWRWGDFVVGDVIVCGHDEDGRSIGLTDNQEKVLREALAR